MRSACNTASGRNGEGGWRFFLRNPYRMQRSKRPQHDRQRTATNDTPPTHPEVGSLRQCRGVSIRRTSARTRSSRWIIGSGTSGGTLSVTGLPSTAVSITSSAYLPHSAVLLLTASSPQPQYRVPVKTTARQAQMEEGRVCNQGGSRQVMHEN